MSFDNLFAREASIRKFEFNKQVVAVFDDMVSRSVPFYNELQDCFVRFGKTFAQSNSNIYDLGCSTCTTLAYVASEVSDETIKFIGMDNSESMLAKSSEKLEQVGLSERFELQTVDLEGDFVIENASVVYLNWTLQFVRPLHRDHLIKKIYNGLRAGGVLVISEKVVVSDSMINGMYIDYYHDYKRSQHYSDAEIARKREALENVLIPYRVDENIELLKRAGFENIDIFFKWFNWAGFLAVKR
ncbi:MAG: carboxy-S-adenosyl-L-methionine synthase CmoA [Lentisphaeria bacterium]